MLFGLFAPKPPLALREKTWIEVRMRWLARQLGLERLQNAHVALPDDDSFPEPYEGTADDARRLMERIGSFMQIDTSSLKLEVCDDSAMPGSAGQYEPGLIRLAASQLEDRRRLVALLAHRLARHLLSGRSLLQHDLDADWVVDLLEVYLGLGVFTANSTLYDEAALQQAGRGWWTIRGYLNSGMLGYALAVFAWLRHEDKPPWASRLGLDAAQSFTAGLRYLDARGDSLFDWETHGTRERPLSWFTLLEQLAADSPSACVAALWELAQRPREGREDPAEAVCVVQKLLCHRLPAVRAEAARALAALGPAAEPAVDDLVQLLMQQNGELRAAASYALGRLSLQAETVVPHLVELLEDRDLLWPAAMAIAAYGPAARAAVPKLRSALMKALGETEYGDVDRLVHALEATAADPAAELREVLAECDAEFRPQAEQMLADRHPVVGGIAAPGAWFGERGR